ncbi:MAG: MinD/ParA family protein [Desulfobulbaceae bacterium]|nr:MAG: MinD/ParA family protein [Desulfobulbaceae bacterium]
MSVSISVGSGKGGTGKSMVIANLAYLLAKSGHRVCVVDLDLGGADTHIMFGLYQPEKTLTDYLTRKTETLSEVIHTFDSFYGLQLIAGTGDTLQTANMTFQEKQRLLRALSTIDTDILLLDVGAGANYHVLDFFMSTDIQLCVSCPDPTSIMDFYKFLQLATIRKALSSFLSQGEVTRALKENHFSTLGEVFELAEQIQQGAKEKTKKALEHFHPLLVINKAGSKARINQLKLAKLAAKYLGIYLPKLGEVPEDKHIMEALKAYLPVCELAPQSPASVALNDICSKLLKVVSLFNEKRSEH